MYNVNRSSIASPDTANRESISSSDPPNRESTTTSSGNATFSTPDPPRTSTRSRKRAHNEKETGEMESALTELIKEHRKNRDQIESHLKAPQQPKEPKSPEEVFFDSCALKIKQLPQQTRSFLQLQISQLFFNAENPNIHPVPITPLPSAPIQPSLAQFQPHQYMCPTFDSQSASHGVTSTCTTTSGIISAAMHMANSM